jgi:hypothetical protein
MAGEGNGDVRLFVSHHSSTYATALEVEALLAERGVSCWISPRDVEPGEPFDKAISKAILGSAGILLLFCEKSDESRHVKRELILADSAARPIIPLRLEAISPRELAYHLADSQWIDWIDRRAAVMDRVAAQARQYAASVPAIEGPLPQTHRAATMEPQRGPTVKPGWVVADVAGVLAIVATTWFLATNGSETDRAGEAPPVVAAMADRAQPAPVEDLAGSTPARADTASAPSTVRPLPSARPTATGAPQPSPAVAAGGPLQRVVDACRGAASDAEYLICAHPELAGRARAMTALIAQVRDHLADDSTNLRQFNAEQRAWFNGVRASCHDLACVLREQSGREGALREWLTR